MGDIEDNRRPEIVLLIDESVYPFGKKENIEKVKVEPSPIEYCDEPIKF